MFVVAKGQITTLAGTYKIINIGSNSYGDYTKSVILLHEIYNGTLLDRNYATGTITARRGNGSSFLRANLVNVSTASAYNGISGTIESIDDNSGWKLRTCLYNNKRYLAVEVPYSAAHHGYGFEFAGWTTSSGENMKCISYEVNGQLVNQLISDIQDYTPNMTITQSVRNYNILGNVGIGTTTPAEKLSVKGKIRAQEIKVEGPSANWPDYVFEPSYNRTSLPDLEQFC